MHGCMQSPQINYYYQLVIIITLSLKVKEKERERERERVHYYFELQQQNGYGQSVRLSVVITKLPFNRVRREEKKVVSGH